MGLVDYALIEIDDVFIPNRRHLWWPWFCSKPMVNVLFYTDAPNKLTAGLLAAYGQVKRAEADGGTYSNDG